MDFLQENWLTLAGLIALLGASATCSGAEAALFSLQRHHLRTLEKDHRLSSRLICRLLNRPQRLLATVLLANFLVNISFFTLAELFAEKIVALPFATQTFDLSALGLQEMALDHLFHFVLLGLALFQVIFFGEILPKILGLRFALAFAHLCVWPIFALFWSLYPVVVVIQLINSLLQKILVGKFKRRRFLLPDELKTLVRLSAERGMIAVDESEMILESLDLGEFKSREVMIPRVEMHTFNLEKNRNDFLDLARRTKRSKFPVFKENQDQILGYLDLQRVLAFPEKSLEMLVQKVAFYPETKRADQLLVSMQRNEEHLAIIVDEYGGTSGLITLNGLLQQILGTVGDGFNPRPSEIVELGPQRWKVPGRLLLHDWSAYFSMPLPPGDSDTLSGYLIAHLGNLPTRDQEIQIEDFHFRIGEVRGQKIRWVELSLETTKNDDKS